MVMENGGEEVSPGDARRSEQISNSERGPPLIDPACARRWLEGKFLKPVTPVPDGRFIIPVPNFDDGKSPILMPNVKELDARLRGSGGTARVIELEASPQIIPTDGTNVIVINRVDEFVAQALSSKLDNLIENANGELTRGVLEEFIGYARGYSYDAETRKITFRENAGFRNDVYNMPTSEFKKKYVRFRRNDLSL